MVFEAEAEKKASIKENGVTLLQPTKPISQHRFRYDVDMLQKNPNAKLAAKKKQKEKNNVSTMQGRPIFSAFEVYEHYLNAQQWDRGSQLPMVMHFVERMAHVQHLIQRLGGEYLHPEFVLWATSAKGTRSSRKCYQTLETYGDTVLKVSATLLAYSRLQADHKKGEKDVDDIKNALINNIHLYRIGMAMRFHKAMRTKDPEQKLYHPPFSHKAEQRINFSCTGKNVADCVESMIGAFIMSNNLKSACQFISDMRLVPLEDAGLMHLFPDAKVAFRLPDNLETFGIGIEETFNSCIEKFLRGSSLYGADEQQRILRAIDPSREVGSVGQAYEDLWRRNLKHKVP
jgi:dsRNA-specific ribonuclease